MLEQEMTTEQDRSGMSREQLESALAQREDQLRRSQSKLEVMQGAEPILLSEIREYKSALKEAKVALEDLTEHRHRDNDGNHVAWVGETTFSIADAALSTINKALNDPRTCQKTSANP